MPLKSGTNLGPYEIESPLGEGGMGEVYRARDSRLGRTVAIKILPAALAQSEDARLRFEREAISSLNHPNICALYDIGHDQGNDYLVMELIEGQSLADRLAKGPMPLNELLPVAIQVADALENAHRNGLVHRDLKPGNVMLTKSGAKLLDFGLAKLLPQQGVVEGVTTGPESNLTVEGSIIGTMQYMSPEQLEGGEVDARSDIFAFGAMLYEMATGKRAFDGSSQASLIASILLEQPVAVSELQPLSPPALERTIMQCLAKSPDDRWQTAGDLKRELKWLESGTWGGIQATEPDAPQTTRKSINRWLAAALAVSLLALTATVGFRLLGTSGAKPVLRKYAFTINNLEVRFSSPASISPNGRMIVYPADGRLWLEDLAEFDSKSVPNTDRSIWENSNGMFWSPDSRWIAYDEDGKIWKQDIRSSERTLICSVPESRRIIGGSWSPSGKIVLAVWRGGLYETNESGGSLKQLLRTDSLLYHDFHTPHFLPDGKTIVLFLHAKEDERNGIGVLREGDTSLTMLMTLPDGGGVCYSNSGHLLYTIVSSSPSIWAVPFSAETLTLTGDPFLVALNGQFPTVSDDGMLVYASNEPRRNVQPLRISLDGRESHPLGPPVIGWTVPRFSPDGRTLFYTAYDDGEWNLWKLDIERGTQTRLTSDSTLEVNPIWLPSRGGYLFNRILGVARGSLEVMDLSTGRVIEVIGQGEDHSVSADGRYITYETDVKGNTDLWYIDTEDSALTPHPLLRTPASESNAVLAPNGKWFAYSVGASRGSQVFLRRFPDARDPIQVSVDGGDWPFWNPSGTTLFYVNDTTLMGVDVTWGDTPHLGAPRIILRPQSESFRGAFTISPDGAYFVAGEVLRNDTRRRMFIVENWFEEFKQQQ